MINSYTWQENDEWRACFVKDITAFVHDSVVLVEAASYGSGDTELEAIGNLCLDEIKRIEDTEYNRLREERQFAARMAPLRRSEWLRMRELATQPQKFYLDDIACWRLYDRGYAVEDFRTWQLTPLGREYIEWFDKFLF